MDITFIISLAVFVFLAALIIILVKKILKVIFFISILLLVFVLAFGFFLYQDAMNIKENLASNKLFLLVDNDEILTGMIIADNEPVFIDENQINEYTNYLKEKDYEAILGDNYKLFLVSLDILNDLKGEYEILNKNVTKDELFNIFRSEEPYKELTGKEEKKKIKADDNEIDSNDKIKFKGFLFMTVLSNDLIRTKNPFKMLLYYKKNYIEVYPETILFKFIKIIPTSFINKMVTKVTANIEKVKEKL